MGLDEVGDSDNLYLLVKQLLILFVDIVIVSC